MKTADFSQYRQLFYFFQYAFAIRGDCLIRSPFDVMYQLAFNTDDFHFREEYISPRKIANSRKNKIPAEYDPAAPMPINPKMSLAEANRFKKLHGFKKKAGHGVLYTAKTESRHRHLMLNSGEYLQTKNGRKWDDFPNLYRALLIYDLFKSGHSSKSVYEEFGNLCLDEISERIKPGRLPYKFAGDVTLEQDLSGILNGTRIYTEEAVQYIHDDAESNEAPFISSCATENADEPLYFYRYCNRIESHYTRALELIQLAETGKFKTFPTEISPLK